MWGIEHLAFAYLVIRPLYALTKRKPHPRLLVLIFAFANLPDALHFGFLRFMLHNLPGLAVFTGLWLFLFRRYRVTRKGEWPVLVLAVATHVVGDLLFSGFYILYPVDSGSYTLYGWMSYEHLAWGGPVVLAFVVLLWASGDWSRLRQYLGGRIREFLERPELGNPLERRWIVLYVYAGLGVLLAVQLALLAYVTRFQPDPWQWRYRILMLTHLLAMGVYASFALGGTPKSRSAHAPPGRR